MTMFPMIHGVVGASSGGPATISSVDDSVDATGQTIYTFSSQALGSAGGRKIIVLVCGGNGARTVSTLTVAGESASLVKRQQAGVEATVEIWSVEFSGATTGDVVVTWSGAQNRCFIGVLAAYGAAAAANDTGGSVADPLSDTLDIPAGGVAVGIAHNDNTNSFTWTNLTEDWDTKENPQVATGASDAFATEQSALAITATDDGAASHHCMALASWGPA